MLGKGNLQDAQPQPQYQRHKPMPQPLEWYRHVQTPTAQHRWKKARTHAKCYPDPKSPRRKEEGEEEGPCFHPCRGAVPWEDRGRRGHLARRLRSIMDGQVSFQLSHPITVSHRENKTKHTKSDSMTSLSSAPLPMRTAYPANPLPLPNLWSMLAPPLPTTVASCSACSSALASAAY